MIGLAWALWHFRFSSIKAPSPGYLARFIPQAIVDSVIFTWVYKSTGGSLLAVILLHGAINTRQYLADWHLLPDTATTQILGGCRFPHRGRILCRYGLKSESVNAGGGPLPEALNRTAESGRVHVKTSTSK